jgi:hypothetical protein
MLLSIDQAAIAYVGSQYAGLSSIWIGAGGRHRADVPIGDLLTGTGSRVLVCALGLDPTNGGSADSPLHLSGAVPRQRLGVRAGWSVVVVELRCEHGNR